MSPFSLPPNKTRRSGATGWLCSQSAANSSLFFFSLFWSSFQGTRFFSPLRRGLPSNTPRKTSACDPIPCPIVQGICLCLQGIHCYEQGL